MLTKIKPQNRIAQAFAVLAATVLSLPAQAQTLADRSSYWGRGWDWGWGHMIGGPLMMILFWGGLIIVIVLAVRGFGGSKSQDGAPSRPVKSALDILEDRFARGEIDKEEFEGRKRILSG